MNVRLLVAALAGVLSGSPLRHLPLRHMPRVFFGGRRLRLDRAHRIAAHVPHQGEREKARRRRQIANEQLTWANGLRI